MKVNSKTFKLAKRENMFNILKTASSRVEAFKSQVQNKRVVSRRCLEAFLQVRKFSREKALVRISKICWSKIKIRFISNSAIRKPTVVVSLNTELKETTQTSTSRTSSTSRSSLTKFQITMTKWTQMIP